MALLKKVTIDKIEIDEQLFVSVRERICVLEDGVPISSAFHRYILSPGDSLHSQPALVAAVSRAAWGLRE